METNELVEKMVDAYYGYADPKAIRNWTSSKGMAAALQVVVDELLVPLTKDEAAIMHRDDLDAIDILASILASRRAKYTRKKTPEERVEVLIDSSRFGACVFLDGVCIFGSNNSQKDAERYARGLRAELQEQQ